MPLKKSAPFIWNIQWKLRKTRFQSNYLLGETNALTPCQTVEMYVCLWHKMDLLRMNIDYRQNFSDFFFFSSCHFVRHPEIERRMNKYFIPKNMTRKKCEMKFVNIRCMHVRRVHVWILIEYQYIHDFICKRKQKVKCIEHLFQIKQWIRYQF